MWPRIAWTKTEIEHHGNNTNNKKCVIVIPVYKKEPTVLEEESLKQAVSVLGGKYELVLLCPNTLDTTIYNRIANYNFSILRCNKDFFKSQKTYSDLCEAWQFYDAFSTYEFMVIYQLDAWIFEDRLDYFIEKDYDYIGAPHLVGYAGVNKEGENGNGGFCLRRISTFLEVAKKTDFSAFKNFEDCAFTQQLKSNFKLAPLDLCREFSFQEKPEIQYRKNGNKLPMGCHAFNRFNSSFWKPYISAYGNAGFKKEDKKVNNATVELMYGAVNSVDTGDRKMTNKDIIVTFTSWKKRIKNVPKVLDTILNQTMLPGKIVLNLSTSEFPNKEMDLPEEVSLSLKKNNVEVFWIDGVNTRQWKKIIPTLKRYPDKWTVCIDDDRLYREDFIEKLWKKHVEFPNNPITVNGGYRVNGCLQHCGHGTLECARFYDYFNGIDIDEIRGKTESSDTMFTYLLNRNGYPLIYCGSDGSSTFNEIEALSRTVGTGDSRKHLEIWSWLSEKYGAINKPKVNMEMSKAKVNEEINNPKTDEDITKDSILTSAYIGAVATNTKRNIYRKRILIRKFRN